MFAGSELARRCATLLAGAFFALTSRAALASPDFTQTFEMNPGWNAIYLEVQPEDDDPASVFAHPAVESVWAWLESSSTLEFIDDPDEEKLDAAGWRAYRTTGPSVLNDLYAIAANRAYLVKLKGGSGVSLAVTGAPSASKTRWVSDSFNLLGFRLAEDGPSFAEYFASSSAHSSGESGVTQAIFRLGADGRWHFVADPAAARMKSGEAYWVYCEGASSHQGPLEVEAESLDFGRNQDRASFEIRNRSSAAKNVSLVELASTGPPALVYRQFNADTGYYDWLELATLPPISLGAGETRTVTLAIRRENLDPGEAASVLEIRDDAGVRWLVPVTAER